MYTNKSRCSSASSRSSNLNTRYNEMRRIQNDNIRMVEKILLVKPTLEKKKHSEFYKQHQEFSRRLSRYSQSSFQDKSQSRTNRSQFPKQSLAVLPDLRPTKPSVKGGFRSNHKYSKSISKAVYSFQ